MRVIEERKEHYIGEKLFTRLQVRLGDYTSKMGKPAVYMKNGYRMDKVTLSDFAEVLYGEKVASITLEDGTVIEME